MQGEPGDDRFAAAWLRLREPADHAARDASLIGPLVDWRRESGLESAQWSVADLGCGTGSTTRWLAPRLPGRQNWTLYDLDPGLLAAAEVGTRRLRAADGAEVSARVHVRDLSTLTSEDMAAHWLVTASALLDLLDQRRLENLVAACDGAACALFTLNVLGEVRLTPADPADQRIADAFNAHQRRVVEGGRLLGPDAVHAAARAFGDHGWTTVVAPSPWRLGPDQADLLAAWLDGWTAAAVEQQPDLAGAVERYRSQRAAELRAGRLYAEVGHADLLALAPTGGA